ncbi:ribosomal protein S19 family protein, partial [Candidatus Hodgkinia cicadicola]
MMFNKIKITTSMVGHKLGEFSFTKKICIHS